MSSIQEKQDAMLQAMISATNTNKELHQEVRQLEDLGFAMAKYIEDIGQYEAAVEFRKSINKILGNMAG